MFYRLWTTLTPPLPTSEVWTESSSQPKKKWRTTNELKVKNRATKAHIETVQAPRWNWKGERKLQIIIYVYMSLQFENKSSYSITIYLLWNRKLVSRLNCSKKGHISYSTPHRVSFEEGHCFQPVGPHKLEKQLTHHELNCQIWNV